jgi:putative phosphoesterase
MKIALLADIHANGDALEVVLRAAKVAGVDRLFIAGDIVGYYYDVDRVLTLLDDWDCAMVRGNHESMLRDWCSGRGRELIHRKYGSGIELASTQLGDRRCEDLYSLPAAREVCVEDFRILICHGSPWDEELYIYPDAGPATRDRMLAGGQNMVVFGHTHFPVVWRSQRGVVVNPGSVGQQRDRKPGACWALWDLQTHEVELRREQYDTMRLVAECRQRDPHLPYLAEVLVRH